MSLIHVEDVGKNKLEYVNKVLGSIGNGEGAMRAINAAAKRAAEKGKTEAGRFAAEEYIINKGSFMSKTKIKMTTSSTSVSISFAGASIPLLEFDTKYARGMRLTSHAKRSTGASIIEHAFAEPVFGRRAVFEHVGGTVGPLEQKFGPSTGHMMQNDIVIDKMDKVMIETFEKRIDHEMSRILNGW